MVCSMRDYFGNAFIQFSLSWSWRGLRWFRYLTCWDVRGRVLSPFSNSEFTRVCSDYICFDCSVFVVFPSSFILCKVRGEITWFWVFDVFESGARISPFDPSFWSFEFFGDVCCYIFLSFTRLALIWTLDGKFTFPRVLALDFSRVELLLL